MKKYFIFSVTIFFVVVFALVPRSSLSQGACTAPNLVDYTAMPPFITTASTPPNVMVVLDNSGSMFNFAYSDGWSTTATADDKNCTNTTTYLCTDFTVGGTKTYPTFKYYGYFDPDYWYTYDGSTRFTPTAPKTGSGLSGARAKTSSEWDGNFLNWISMRRMDVIRKVMTGGLYVASGSEKRLITEIADSSTRGIYKQITTAENYTPYSGTKTFTFATGSANPSQFAVSGVAGMFNLRIASVANSTPQGIIQRIGNQVRWGLTFYRPNTGSTQGGYVQVNIAGGSQPSTINYINNKRPDSNTPLGETLWMDVGYFAQTTSGAALGFGTPGPSYQSADYTVNNAADPYNYGTGGQPSYISCSKSFILYITDGEPCADGYLPSGLSDYASGKSDYNCSGSSCPAVGSFSASTFPTCGAGDNVAGIEDVALFAHTNDIRTSATKDISGTQSPTIYPVFAFGKGSTLLRYAAINGGFIDSNSNNQPDLQSEWDADGNGEPDNFFEADEGYALESNLLIAFNSILNRSSSGGAASVLATTGEGEGAVYQALFIPGTQGSSATEANWRGYVQGLFLDKYGNLREDTISDDTLDYTADKIVVMFYDQTASPPRTRVYRYDDNDGDGQPDGAAVTLDLENITPLWEGGKILWSTLPSTRKIYTSIDGSNIYDYDPTVYKVTDSFEATIATHATTLRPYLRASTDAEATNIINHIRGSSISGYRTRNFTIGGITNTWKLGDIINASPTLVAKPSENYDLIYGDGTYTAFRSTYANRRHVLYVGANDGMLHAFNAGFYDTATHSYSAGSGKILGEELWSFIPTDLLPHLKWLTDPSYTHVYYVDLKPKVTDVRIFNDAATSVSGLTDGQSGVSHPNGWGTILIGSMRFGGKEICVLDSAFTGGEKRFYSSYFAFDITDPEKPPKLLWTFNHADLGLTTSYPAVLRTGNKNTYGTWFVVFGSGPTNYDAVSTKAGNIFVLNLATGALERNFAGPTTLMDYAFMADPITVDVSLDYKVDAIYIGNTYCDNPIDSLDPSKCSSSNWKGKMYRIATKPNAASDPSATPADWTLSTLFDSGLPASPATTANNPPGQPISSAPSAAMDKYGNLWIFFGAGRFWHADDKAIDGTETWNFYGVKDECKPWIDPAAAACSTPTTLTDLYNSTTVDVCPGGIVTSCSSVYGTPTPWNTVKNDARLKKGWYLNFPAAGERALSKPLVIGGLVAWTAYIPNQNDPCAFEGTSKLYAVYYETGTAYSKYVFDPLVYSQPGAVIRSVDLGVGVPSSVGAVATGDNTLMGFIQQSTGTIMQIEQVTPFAIKSGIAGWRPGVMP
jgi:type IV pilus assembly protein PilY1